MAEIPVELPKTKVLAKDIGNNLYEITLLTLKKTEKGIEEYCFDNTPPFNVMKKDVEATLALLKEGVAVQEEILAQIIALEKVEEPMKK